MSQPPQQPAPRGERYSENNLVWVDMEMSGLDPDSDHVLEIAILITDAELELVAEGTVLVLHQAVEVLAGMDSWNTSTHGR